MMPRAYRYVGPRDIADRASAAPPGPVVASADDIIAWAMSAGPANDRITATFVVASQRAGRRPRLGRSLALPESHKVICISVS
jgi:hypothetical protein